MSWSQAQNADLDGLLALGCGVEWRAVPFTARLRQRGAAVLPPRRESSVLVHRPAPGGDVDAALLLTASGLLLPVLGAPGSLGQAPPFPVWPRLRRVLHSVMGPSTEVLWAEAGLGRRPRHTVDYHLMVLARERFRAGQAASRPAPPGLALRPASLKDAAALYPLQRDYELEEVLIVPGHFHPKACLANLRLSLRQQLVVVAELASRAVAKAGTNARGFTTDQIGGVFTVVSQRNRGIAHAAMRALLERIFREKESACLFVKKSNPPAVALYQGLGFQILEGYRISYYRD
jgi:ribosomal protein S18 acetylase RimI-like enzyme